MTHIRNVNVDPVSNLMNALQYRAPGLGNRPDNLCRYQENTVSGFQKTCAKKEALVLEIQLRVLVSPSPAYATSESIFYVRARVPEHVTIYPLFYMSFSSFPFFLPQSYNVEQSLHTGGLGSPRFRCQVIFINVCDAWRASGLNDACEWSEWCRSKKQAKREAATAAMVRASLVLEIRPARGRIALPCRLSPPLSASRLPVPSAFQSF